MPELRIQNNGYWYTINCDTKTVDDQEYYFISFRYNPWLVGEIKMLEKVRWDGEKYWVAPVTTRNAYYLGRLAGEEDFRYDKEHPLVPTSRPELKEHQKRMVAQGFWAHRTVIAGEMGVGKTLAAIELMEVAPKDNKWIVVCPARAKIVWEMELNKWKAKVRPYKIISYAKLKDLKYQGENIIYDEGHALANWTAKRTQKAYQMARESMSYIIVLSGTPSPRDPTNWWSLAETLQPGFLREPNVFKFKERLGLFETHVGKGEREFKKLVKWWPEEIKLLRKRLKGMVLPVLKKDCLDLPEKTYQEVQLPYGRTEQQLVQSLVKTRGRGIQILQRLRQFSDGFMYHATCTHCHGQKKIDGLLCGKCDGSGEIERDYNTPKDLAIQQYLSEFIQEGGLDYGDGIAPPRLVIFAAYRRSIDKIVGFAKELGWNTIRVDGRGIETSRFTLEQFQSRECREPIVFIGNPDSGGQGFTLNLSENIIYYSNDFNGKSRLQSEDRIHRIGTTRANIIDLLWLPTDRYILENLKDKKDLQGVTLGQIEEYIERTKGDYDSFN